jgi:hypothetical protein
MSGKRQGGVAIKTIVEFSIKKAQFIGTLFGHISYYCKSGRRAELIKYNNRQL